MLTAERKDSTPSNNGQPANGSEFSRKLNDDLNARAANDNEPTARREAERLDAILQAARVRPTDNVPPASVCLTIEVSGQQFRLGTLGNISTLSGKAKSKKTVAVCIAIAAAVGTSLIIDRIKGHLPTDRQNVLFFDTEQSREDVHRIAQRICRLSGLEDPPSLHIYSLRPESPDDRLAAIGRAINQTPNIGLVVIDGVRDLAADPITDSDQASKIVTHLLQWSSRFGIHIMCVLHENKHDKTLRGFLGTELVNKSETVLSVTKSPEDSSVSTVAPEYCRGREFEPFSFALDVEDNITLTDTQATQPPSGRKRKPTAADLSPEQVEQMLQRAFKTVTRLRYRELQTNLVEAAQHSGVDLAKSRAEELIRRILLNGYVTKGRQYSEKCDMYQLAQDKLPVQLS